MLAEKINITKDLEQLYINSTTADHRKKFAQFFTPWEIADLMAKWLIGNKDLKKVLEPAFGLGIFSRTLLRYNNDINITGFEIDEKIYSEAKRFYKNNSQINLLLEDYMYNDWNNKYDGIICNPPYFKFHDYDNLNILKELEDRTKCRLNGFTNLYTLFLLKSVYQLAENGRAAYIIPSEFLNSDYGKAVKTYLIESKMLRHIIVVDFKENVFTDALTTASILLLANDNKSEQVQFTNINSIDELGKIDKVIKNYPLYSDDKKIFNFENLDASIKWKKYYQTQNSINFTNLVPFSKYAKVVRGIATGDNDYFTFNKTKAEKYNIDTQFLLPCICRSADVKNSFFTATDFEKLRNADKNIFLINAINANDSNVLKYLDDGEKLEVNKKYLTSKRNPWYSLEKRTPAPIWVSVFNRNGLRFIRNEANISNLTTFHCIYPLKTDLFGGIDDNLLFAYLLTDVAKQIFEDNSREYGNGLQKFEPNDINKAKMLDLDTINIQSKEEILNHYNLYRKSVVENRTDSALVDKINEIFIKLFKIIMII